MKKYLGFIFGLIVTGLFFSACNNEEQYKGYGNS